MNRLKALLTLRTFALPLSCTLGLLVARPGLAQVQHLAITQPGGMPGAPLITGIQRATNRVTVTWDGPSGYYQLFQKVGLNGKWQAVGPRTNLVRTATVSTTAANTFYKIKGPAPQYAGAQACTECHGTVHSTEQYTAHAQAFKQLQQVGQASNPACLPCHTVGYGLATGFVSASATPQLEGVQCENCHGPAGNHAANPGDPTVVPQIEVAATVCGGCHTGSQHPTYEEWSASGHATVTLPNMDPLTCGRCHIGPARIAMVKHEPVATNDTQLAVVCAVCHDPHSNHTFTNSLSGLVDFTNPLTGIPVVVTNSELGKTYTVQLRNPLNSTRDYSLSTSDVFSNKYNASINLCAQCHNDRGGSWTDTDRAPHHSPQYNMMLGTVGVLDSGTAPNLPSTHSKLEKQCVTCHMQTSAHQDGPPEVAAVTGHLFEVQTYDACARCHGSAANGQALAGFAKEAIQYRIQQIKQDLDLWATTKAPLSLRTNYGALAWEYTHPGDLSSGGSGPNASEQLQLPPNIRKARFDLYLVLYDGSYGVHNGPYAITLLDTAENWVLDALTN